MADQQYEAGTQGCLDAGDYKVLRKFLGDEAFEVYATQKVKDVILSKNGKDDSAIACCAELGQTKQEKACAFLKHFVSRMP